MGGAKYATVPPRGKTSTIHNAGRRERPQCCQAKQQQYIMRGEEKCNSTERQNSNNKHTKCGEAKLQHYICREAKNATVPRGEASTIYMRGGKKCKLRCQFSFFGASMSSSVGQRDYLIRS
jgi:hypothetical protein